MLNNSTNVKLAVNMVLTESVHPLPVSPSYEKYIRNTISLLDGKTKCARTKTERYAISQSLEDTPSPQIANLINIIIAMYNNHILEMK